MRTRRFTLMAAVGLALIGGGLVNAPASAVASEKAVAGPCRAELFADALGVGARSVCPPGTYRHWHQAHVSCFHPQQHPVPFTLSGPVVGGTSVSQVRCLYGHTVSNFWNTQGPDD
ncbi:hypothetical protein ACSMX9_06405 [Streptomyces sp. LE64]|uniref:hypothetical protein n=1 Tax=Streptomyces sp. LE64 TaxID=3448653 RepID=UPI0040431873